MLKIVVTKIELPDERYRVLFETEWKGDFAQTAILPEVNLSRAGTKMYRVDNLASHNGSASGNHTKDTVDEYIKRVLNEIVVKMEKAHLAINQEKVEIGNLEIPVIVINPTEQKKAEQSQTEETDTEEQQ